MMEDQARVTPDTGASGEGNESSGGDGAGEGGAKRRRSRGRRGGKGRGKTRDAAAAPAESETKAETSEPVEAEPADEPVEAAAPASDEAAEAGAESGEGRPKRRRSRGRRGKGGGSGGSGSGGSGSGGGQRESAERPSSGRGGERRERRERSEGRERSTPSALPAVKREMVINYVPGEECRVAVLEDAKLEEFHSERADAVSHVGNIYLGKVVNVEPAIQAAFVDFGLEQAAFLHVSDLHPRYFPGEDGETTEQVGKKVPRRDRPPIQACLRRGQEIVVQVLKEGVGTKGPTVTSYLSIPGRFLVMMPLMDRVGVSRKVEDEDTRRQMRQILDQLDLPDGFGFVLRTAGMDRTKTELKRDLAYLLRLWKDMEKRWKQGSAPRLLYAESDLLVRALRDMLATDIERIVIDNEAALTRASKFLKIVAPRTAAGLVHYTGRVPLFHVTGVEPQIRNIHAREVPLPSGGRLVIDETEALVAIDVNSGKSRDAGDSETNAYNTNMEAAEEICRQLRLRDVGGIIINDLIDMRASKHRREVEARFKELLKKDRAKSTLETISDFGILEMTRQRMRGSQESLHFSTCPTCRGRGLVQKSDSVASDALRELATLLEHNRVWRVEMVVSPRIAGELLSTKRRALNRLERAGGKRIDVRISEAIPVDRVAFYAYDDRGADIDVDKLSLPRVDPSQLVPWEKDLKLDDWTIDAESEGKASQASEPVDNEPAPGEEHADFLSSTDFDDLEQPVEVSGERSGLPGLTGEAGRGRRGRRGRGGRGGEGRGGDGRSEGRGRDDRGEGRGGDGRGSEGRDSRGGGNNGQQGQGRRQDQQHQHDRRDPAHAENDNHHPRDHDQAEDAGEPAHNGADGHGHDHANGSGEPGEGGRRRRRRRRRGRGGRGGGNGGSDGAAHDSGAESRHDHDENDRHDEPRQERSDQDDRSRDEGRAPARAASRPRDEEPAEESQYVARGTMGDHGDSDDAEVSSDDDRNDGGPSEAPADRESDQEGDREGGDHAGEGGGDAQGEGAGRRRRRRRRGRGGRGRGGEGEGQGGQVQGNGGGGGERADQAHSESPPRNDRNDRGERNERGDRGDRGERRDGRDEGRPQSRGEGRGDGRGEGRGGGRDRDRDRDRDGARNRSGQQSRGGGNSGGEGRGGEGRAERSAPPKEPKPAPAPAPAAGEPKPRTLYGFRRKLNPSERYRTGQE